MKKPRTKPEMPPPERRVVLCVVGAPHGVRGECRMKAFTADPLSITDYGPLFAEDGRVFKIIDGRLLKDDMLVVRFEGVTDRDVVAKLTNTELFVDRDALPPPEDEEEFYHADLIGLDIVNIGGNIIGKLIAVHDFGAGDVLEIRPTTGGGTSAGTWLLPFTKVAAPRVEVAKRRVVIDPDFLQKPEPAREKPYRLPEKMRAKPARQSDGGKSDGDKREAHVQPARDPGETKPE